MKIAVYLGSNPGDDEMYMNCAKEVGHWIGEHGHDLVYGGADCGMMGAVADAALESGAKVYGVIPEFLQYRCHRSLTELVVTKDMSKRKAKMIELADAYLALPGGPGTIEEISEIISSLRLSLFKKPCMIYSLNDYYKPLEEMYLRMVEHGFLTQGEYDRIVFVKSVDEIADTIDRGNGN